MAHFFDFKVYAYKPEILETLTNKLNNNPKVYGIKLENEQELSFSITVPFPEEEINQICSEFPDEQIDFCWSSDLTGRNTYWGSNIDGEFIEDFQ